MQRNRKRTIPGVQRSCALVLTFNSIVLFALAFRGLEAQEGDPAPGAAPDTAGAANAPGSSAAGAEDKGPAPVFFLRDRSKIAGHPRLEALEVETQYGALSIPADQLVRVRFSRRLAEDVRARIEGLISDLGDEDFDKREAATKALEELGSPALDLLRGAAKSPDEEIKNRAEILLGKINEKAPESTNDSEDVLTNLDGQDDEIITSRMTIKGRIPRTEFLIDSLYGELRVATADLGGIVFRATGPTSTKVSVPSTHSPPGNWFDTKFEVERGQKLKIEATGQVSVRNYGILAGPDGNRDWGGTSFNNLPMLSLVGKIGKRGQPFLIGNSYQGKAKGAGRLYLAVVPFSPNPGGASGSYNATIQATGGE
ncbi:MAG TPA: HEAT repeat domain-containing protein [Planctomycetota bacterium]|nr:HEAT repeat domain-containing protein [Planctomycetota bacterium]